MNSNFDNLENIRVLLKQETVETMTGEEEEEG